MLQIRKATRKQSKLRLGLCAPSGAGKTYSSILIAKGLGGKIGLIDTENGSGELYADLTDYDVITITAPFEVSKYLEAIKAFEQANYSVIIIDSLSHAWAGSGGLLDKQGKIADSGRGNSYTAWREVTPDHNKLVDAILQSPCHIIATMRAKTEYVIEKNDKGKDVPKKVGMAPVQRDGMEYEFTVVFDLSMSHIATASKDRTSLFDGRYFKPDVETGEQLLGWLNSGEKPAEPAKLATQESSDRIAALKDYLRQGQEITTEAGLKRWYVYGVKEFSDVPGTKEKLTQVKDLMKEELGLNPPPKTEGLNHISSSLPQVPK